MFNRKLITPFVLSTAVMLTSCTNPAYNKEVDKAYKTTQSSIKQYKRHESKPKFIVSDNRYTSYQLNKINPNWYKTPVELHVYQQPLVSVMHIIDPNHQLQFVYMGKIANHPININYKGDLIGALNQIMQKNNIFFEIQGKDQNRVRWSYDETKTFEIAFMPGTTSFNVGGSTGSLGTGGTNGGAKSSNSATLKGDVSVWNDIESSINKLLSTSGKLDVSQATSTVTVMDKPLNVEAIQKFINNYNKVLSSRVRIHIKILEVQLTKQHQYGIDWNAVYKGAELGGMTGNAVSSLAGFGMNISGNTSTSTNTSSTSSSNWNWENSSLFINALDGQGKVSVIDEPTITSLNNSPNAISVTDKQAYIKSTSITTTGVGTSLQQDYSIDPADIITGLKMTLIPHIQGNKIYLSIDGDLSSLLNIETKTFGVSGQNSMEVQLPEVSSKTFNQRVMVQNKHLLVLSGLKTQSKKSENNKNFGTKLLGSNSDDISNKELVILIEPEIVK